MLNTITRNNRFLLNILLNFLADLIYYSCLHCSLHSSYTGLLKILEHTRSDASVSESFYWFSLCPKCFSPRYIYICGSLLLTLQVTFCPNVTFSMMPRFSNHLYLLYFPPLYLVPSNILYGTLIYYVYSKLPPSRM